MARKRLAGPSARQVPQVGDDLDRLKGAGALRGVTIGSDQLVPLALPILAGRGIRVDDDPPDLVGS